MRYKLILILILVVSYTKAQFKNDLFDLENRIKFANFLYQQKDYLRAIDEYKIILQQTENDTLRFRFANSFLKLNRYEEASENFKTLFFSSLSDEAKLFFFESNFLKNDFDLFRKNFSKENYIPQKFRSEIERLNSITFFLSNEKLPQQENLLKPFDDSLQTKLYLFYQLKKNPPTKNPYQAAIFSAIIPGAGKIYTGEISDGIISFIATTLSLYLSINNFQHDHNTRGWIFAGLTSFFYGGNVYGSYVSAKKYNENSKVKIQNDIKNYLQERNYFLPQIDF